MTFYVQFEEKSDAVKRSKQLQEKLLVTKFCLLKRRSNLSRHDLVYRARGDDAVSVFLLAEQADLPETELTAAARQAAAFINDQRLSL